MAMVQDEWRNHKDDQSVARAQNIVPLMGSTHHIGLHPPLTCPDLKGVESGAAMEGSGREGGLGEARQRAGYFFSERHDLLA